MKHIRIFTLPVLGLLFIGWVVSLSPEKVGTDELPLWWVAVCVAVMILTGVIGWVKESRKENARNATGIVVVTATKKNRKFNLWGLLIFAAGAWLFYEVILKDVFSG